MSIRLSSQRIEGRDCGMLVVYVGGGGSLPLVEVW